MALARLFPVLVAILTTLFSPLFSVEKKVVSISVREAITPPTRRYITRVIRETEKSGWDAVLIELDTPGGLLEATRDIVQEILNTRLDTIVFVSPQGARAGSAGVFITLSARYAAMAPGCNIGAAHPVSLTGGKTEDGDQGKIMSQKIQNDTVAFMESIAAVRNRNRDWAVRTVRESVSLTANEALSRGLIDTVAADRQELLKKIYGARTEIRVREADKNWAEKLLSILANPNLAYFLLILGFYGILYEIIHPGTIFSGALGAILLVIALYSMQTLPFNFAGFFLILIAFVLFVLEAFVVSYGLLTVGGILSLVLGSALLFDPSQPIFRIAISSILTVSVTTLLVVGGLLLMAGRMIRKNPSSGVEGMTGERGTALGDFQDGRGKVRVHGEIWNAVCRRPLKDRESVTVKSVKNLTLEVD